MAPSIEGVRPIPGAAGPPPSQLRYHHPRGYNQPTPPQEGTINPHRYTEVQTNPLGTTLGYYPPTRVLHTHSRRVHPSHWCTHHPLGYTATGWVMVQVGHGRGVDPDWGSSLATTRTPPGVVMNRRGGRGSRRARPEPHPWRPPPPPSLVLFLPLQPWHRTWQLPSSFDPPSLAGTMWSTVSRSRLPHSEHHGCVANTWARTFCHWDVLRARRAGSHPGQREPRSTSRPQSRQGRGAIRQPQAAALSHDAASPWWPQPWRSRGAAGFRRPGQ